MRFVAAAARETVELFFRLHSLGDCRHSERVGQLDDGGYQGATTTIVWQVAGKDAVYLEAVDRQLRQTRQRGIAGAKVVDRDTDASRAQQP